MSQDRPRYQLSREEIGILLSFAKRPEAVDREWVRRLQGGVDRAALTEFVALAGLPRDSVQRIMATRSLDNVSTGQWSQGSPGYRRAIVGVVVVYVLAAVTLTFATGDDMLRSSVLATTFALSGYLLYRTIVRLSRGAM